MNRSDFLMLDTGVIYFDNGATTLKPTVLSDKTSEYYNCYSCNAHRGDYSLSLKVDMEYEHVRTLVKNFIGAKSESEIVFTSGTTDSLNKIIFGYFKNILTKGDEVLLDKSEHASNVLPWFELADELGLVIKYIDLDKNHKITLDNVKRAVTDKTKVISIAHVSNVVGDIRPIKEICEYAHSKDILVLVDGAQSVAHMAVDVRDLDIDFLAFSAHKMYGPTGVGVLYGKEEILKNIKPIIFGGGMNSIYDSDFTRIYDELPSLLEAGTPNIAGVIGFGSVIDYLNNIGMDNIKKHEDDLRKYAVSRLKEIDNLIIYNEESESSIITINYSDIFAQDLSIYLNKYNICVRAGNHCSKILKDELNIKNTVRISFGLYNTKDEVDQLVSALKNPKIKEEIL